MRNVITIIESESPYLCNRGFATFTAARASLEAAASAIARRGGYDKTWFRINLDGEEPYEGRLDVTPHGSARARCFGAHVVGFWSLARTTDLGRGMYPEGPELTASLAFVQRVINAMRAEGLPLPMDVARDARGAGFECPLVSIGAPAPERPAPPAPTPKKREGGPKWVSGRNITETASLIRKDIAARVRAGEIAPIRVSVRISRYSMGRSVTVEILEAPAGIMNPARVLAPHSREPFYSDAGRAILRAVEHLVADYNRDDSDPMTDYSDVDFHAHVRFAHDIEEADRARIIAAHAAHGLTEADLPSLDAEPESYALAAWA